MNKKEFLSTLKNQLRKLEKEELDEIIKDYEDHIEIGIKKGRKEKEIIHALGDPKTIAKQIKADYHITKAEEKFSAANMARAVYATIGLGLFNIILVLGPFLAILAILLALFVVGAALVIAGITIMAVCFVLLFIPQFQSIIPALIGGIFAGFGVICFGSLFVIGNYYLSKLFYILVIKYLKLNLRIIKGEKDE